MQHPVQWLISCSIIFLTSIHSQQVKKLVYLYLVRYAEEQQDLALLSISTFQKGLKVGQGFVDCDLLYGNIDASYQGTFFGAAFNLFIYCIT